MKELIFKVEGMVCNGCSNRIQNAVKQLKGVEKVIANYKDGNVIVTVNEEINKELIKAKIKDIGFEVKE